MPASQSGRVHSAALSIKPFRKQQVSNTRSSWPHFRWFLGLFLSGSLLPPLSLFHLLRHRNENMTHSHSIRIVQGKCPPISYLLEREQNQAWQLLSCPLKNIYIILLETRLPLCHSLTGCCLDERLTTICNNDGGGGGCPPTRASVSRASIFA